MSDAVNFTMDSARKIAGTVRGYNGAPVDTSGNESGRRPFGSSVKVKITSNAGGAGKYFGKSMSVNHTTPTAGTALTLADVGVVADTEDVLFENLDEVDVSGHALAVGTIIVGFLADYTADTPRKLIVEGRGGGSEPIGQYQGMLRQNVTDLQMGSDFLCSHAMESI